MTYELLMASIAQLQAAEKITREKLSELSRSILLFLVESEDVRPINALLGKGEDDQFILTPVNWRIAAQYFHHFLPFDSNYNDIRECVINGGKREPMVFGKKKKKVADKKFDAIREWLDDDTNDIWSWSNNVKVEAKPVDYAKRLTSAVESAIDPEKGAMTTDAVLAALFAGGVSIQDLMDAIPDDMQEQGEIQEAMANAA